MELFGDGEVEIGTNSRDGDDEESEYSTTPEHDVEHIKEAGQNMVERRWMRPGHVLHNLQEEKRKIVEQDDGSQRYCR